ncbi:hypothetical protein FisN_4Hh104 [Fistulifera solaris]|uniref:Uncharacterized protein n=1 Tax=Fistulifera solaris TaxID=1519565 RepID=A0A1Z5KEH4_FISSO|nr:hypothetical protein FisN_4Hh104 [Fistulifera solaris]|eukprot:GAX24586.1 hypothetical protein FisN_4Hh104 [Fistulifera solaris]
MSFSMFVSPAVFDDSANSQNDLETPLIEQKPTAVVSNQVSYFQKAAHFIMGALIGITFSVAGFYILMHQYSLASWGRLQIVAFALLWSGSTGITSFLSFTALHKVCLATSTLKQEHLEYFYALGVFAGFCSACTVTDVRYGLPLSSILMTFGVACAWALLMTLSKPPVITDAQEQSQSNEVKAVKQLQVV